MLKDCWKLLKIQLLQLFGLNEIRYSKDKRKRRNALLMAVCYLFVGAALVLYVGMVAYSLQMIDMVELIPSYMVTMTSAIILIFTIFKASGMLFGSKDYEMLTALPISPKAMVISRFFAMYVNNVLLTAVIIFPSIFIYVNYVKVTVLSYIYIIKSVFLIPLIPMTIACIISALITAVASRMKHKNLMTVLLSTVLCLGTMALSFGGQNMNQGDMSDLSLLLTEKLQEIYPVGALFSKAVNEGSILSFLAFAMISIFVFALFVCLTAWKYADINSALKVHATKSNYIMTEIKTKSATQALYEKEGKRYFSSSIYVLNTGFGYILMLILGIIVFVAGTDQLESMMGIPGAADMVRKFAPIMIGAMTCMSPPSTASISLEGKQWEGLMALPLTTKNILDSKIKWSLTLAVPSILITSTLLSASLRVDLLSMFLMYAVPLSYALFAAVAGIYINLKLPNFKWENEAMVVKQSAATMLFLLIGFASFLAPIGLFFVLKEVELEVIMCAVTILLSFISWILYRNSIKIDLRKIAE